MFLLGSLRTIYIIGCALSLTANGLYAYMIYKDRHKGKRNTLNEKENS